MIRISKLSDYALRLMAYLSKDSAHFTQTGDIALNTHIAKPTAAKLLKQLAKHGLLESHRGTTGGYKLAKNPQEISAANIIEIVEGPLAIMDCTLGADHCAMYNNCSINAPWAHINRVIINSLDTIKLSDMHPVNMKHEEVHD